ncbi:endonuclease/exonuclease/phosphatase family protein [Trichloromonas sp.]|uniref:endonuclease/exonuclease/phosphatase family protein n=1 Tax=Trichloromonas sp. TaxID=3069249 RepID=UPI003D814592
MTTIRIMTYFVRKCRGGDGQVDLDRIADVIAEGAPDIVALQDVGDEAASDQIVTLSRRLGMKSYAAPGCGGNAFLSYYPLKGVLAYDLGKGGSCLRADADIDGKRLHLLNLRLKTGKLERQQQISSLLGPDLLGDRALTCPTLILGDFADYYWGAGNMALNMNLSKGVRSLWRGTFPACCPVVDRDRAYTRGHLRIVDSTILWSKLARRASTHLPLIVTAQITDPRTFLRTEKLKRSRMEVAPG